MMCSQVMEDLVQAELAATQAAQRRRIETLKTYVTPASSHTLDLGSKSPRLIVGGAGDHHSKFFLTSSSSPSFNPPGASMWRPTDLDTSSVVGLSSSSSQHPAAASLDRPAAWSAPSATNSLDRPAALSVPSAATSLDLPAAWSVPSASASYTGLVGGCEHAPSSSSSQALVPVSSTAEYHQISGIHTKP